LSIEGGNYCPRCESVSNVGGLTDRVYKIMMQLNVCGEAFRAVRPWYLLVCGIVFLLIKVVI